MSYVLVICYIILYFLPNVSRHVNTYSNLFFSIFRLRDILRRDSPNFTVGYLMACKDPVFK